MNTMAKSPGSPSGCPLRGVKRDEARSPIRVIWPSLVAALACLVFAGSRLIQSGGDAVALAERGTLYSDLDPQGTQGYDGQFTYTIAVTFDPREVEPHLDRAAYRYQRILYPLAARLISLGYAPAVPWALLAIAVASAAFGTAALATWMLDHGQWEGYALGYGLWVGVVASPGLFLHEAVAYGLVALGWIASRASRPGWGAIALNLALFAKETTLPFWAASFAIGGATTQQDRRRRLWLAAGGVAFLLWQIWLWRVFGEVGLGSGGAMSTPFELIPLMGFARIGLVSLPALALFLLIFGPTVILPTLWGLQASVRRLRLDRRQAEAWALALNVALILFVPFSTAREPLGLVRFATGLVLAVLLFAAAFGLRRVLNYSMFWSAMLVLLVRR